MVTAVVNNPGAVVGQVLDWEGARTFSVVVPTGALTRGDIIAHDGGTSPDSYKLFTAAASIPGPFAMVLQDKAAGVLHASVVQGGVWVVTADGAIELGEPVKLSASTDGQVIALPAIDVTATYTEATIEAAINSRFLQVGTCLGFADSYNTGSQVAVVDGDLVAIDANKAGV